MYASNASKHRITCSVSIIYIQAKPPRLCLWLKWNINANNTNTQSDKYIIVSLEYVMRVCVCLCVNGTFHKFQFSPSKLIPDTDEIGKEETEKWNIWDYACLCAANLMFQNRFRWNSKLFMSKNNRLKVDVTYIWYLMFVVCWSSLLCYYWSTFYWQKFWFHRWQIVVVAAVVAVVDYFDVEDDVDLRQIDNVETGPVPYWDCCLMMFHDLFQIH